QRHGLTLRPYASSSPTRISTCLASRPLMEHGERRELSSSERCAGSWWRIEFATRGNAGYDSCSPIISESKERLCEKHFLGRVPAGAVPSGNRSQRPSECFSQSLSFDSEIIGEHES